VLGTANRSEPRPGLDFFALTVDFEERMYAAGKIPGGFIKRESRPSEAAILAARLTDRPIRPLFPEGYKDDVQVVITVLSTDQENDPDVLGTIAASAALTISEIPFQGPIGAVRVGRIDGEFVINPTISQLADSELDLIVSGTRDAIMMVEAGAKILPEDVMAEAILFAHRAIRPLIDVQEELQKAVGKPKRLPFIEPGTESVLEFVKAIDAGKELVVVDVETTGTDPKLADLLEIGAVKVKGGKITDRWSTLVNPGRSIVGNQMHGITDKDVKGAPSPKDAAGQFLAFAGDSTWGSTSASSRRRWATATGSSRAATSTRSRSRAKAFRAAPSRTSSRISPGSLASTCRRTTARCRTPKRPRRSCSRSPQTSRTGSTGSARRSRTASGPTATVAIRRPSSRRHAARRASERACSA
jgi:hypothetical protein